MLDWVLMNAGPILTTIFAMVGGWLAKSVITKVGSEWARGVLQRAYDEITSAVMEIQQTYVDAIKAGKADGKLTDAEKKAAKEMAIQTAKANIGGKGLKRLMRVLGLDLPGMDGWFSNKVEAQVGAKKLPLA